MSHPVTQPAPSSPAAPPPYEPPQAEDSYSGWVFAGLILGGLFGAALCAAFEAKHGGSTLRLVSAIVGGVAFGVLLGLSRWSRTGALVGGTVATMIGAGLLSSGVVPGGEGLEPWERLFLDVLFGATRTAILGAAAGAILGAIAQGVAGTGR
jgi:predicted lipid-binding transport protein (Tim44 family)